MGGTPGYQGGALHAAHRGFPVNAVKAEVSGLRHLKDARLKIPVVPGPEAVVGP